MSVQAPIQDLCQQARQALSQGEPRNAQQLFLQALAQKPDSADIHYGLGTTCFVLADHNGAVYVIAVNASRAPATATITVPALVDRELVTLDGQHKASAKDGAFTATFAPLEARIYIAAPPA